MSGKPGPGLHNLLVYVPGSGTSPNRAPNPAPPAEEARSLSQLPYQQPFQNGIAIQRDPASYSTCKPAGDMPQHCLPGMVNNSFSIGIQNTQGQQRILQQDVFNSITKVNEKSVNGHLIQSGLCGNGFVELNHEQLQVGRGVVTLSRSDSVRSETGESCSSMSSGDSQNDCPGNILILPGQMPNAMQGQHMMNQNQLVLNQNHGVVNHAQGSGNIVITNSSNGGLQNQMDCSHPGQHVMPNYQLLEQNISQQSIVNQSISIVNQQIIANRGGSSNSTENGEHREVGASNQMRMAFDNNVHMGNEGVVRQGLHGMEGELVLVNNVPHHLVRTPNGLVLGVMPSKPSAVTSGVSVGVGVGAGVVNGVHSAEGSVGQADTRPAAPHVTVPYGWNRIVNGTSVVYMSPSGYALCSLEQVQEYLQAGDTCKCGLDCPLRPECTFNFDPEVAGRPSSSLGPLPRLGCGVSRRPPPHQPPQPAKESPPSPSRPSSPRDTRKDLPVGKKRKRKNNPYSGVSVSQLLVRREMMQQQLQQMQQNPQTHLQELQQNDKERVWLNNPQNPNGGVSMMHPNPAGSPTVPQFRFNGQPVNNFPSGMQQQPGIVMYQGAQQNMKPENANNSMHPAEMQMHNRNQMGSQVLTINGNSLVNQSSNVVLEPQQRVMQHQVILNPNHNMNNLEAQPYPRNNMNPHFTGVNHVIGPNGQIMGIHTSNMSRSQSMGNMHSNEEKIMKCEEPDVKPDQQQIVKSPSRNETCSADNSKNITQAPSQNVQIISNNVILPTSQQPNPGHHLQVNSSNPSMMTSSDINQQLTPEVIQRINQQQQIFIQQNQKQMELAMKGIKTHAVPTSSQPNASIRSNTYNESPGNQGPQGQLIVSGNSVMMANQQRMPPWQLNRINKLNQSNQNQGMQLVQNRVGVGGRHPENVETTPQNMYQQLNNQHSMESGAAGLQPNPGANVGSQNIYSRVPPLHRPAQQAWPEEVQKKKSKIGKSAKKPRPYNVIENQRIHGGNPSMQNPNALHSNIDRIHSQDFRVGQQNHSPNFSNVINSSPSFMEDPSGYLAQQTALLNSTISRQVGLNPMPCSPMQNSMNLKNSHSDARDEVSLPNNQKAFIRNGNNQNSVKSDCNNPGKSNEPPQGNLPSQSNLPDSSINSDKSSDSSNMQQMHSQCQGCIAEMNESKNSNSVRNINMNDCDLRFRNVNFQSKMQNYIQGLSSSKSDSNSQPGTPSPNQSSDESPVTSSTFAERSANRSNMNADGRGPIQGGIISTSNGSPVETFALPELSPTPSNSSRNTDTPQSKNSGSIHISSSCPFTNASPAYSNQGSSRESINSNPATPSPGHNQNYASYSSPGPMSNQSSNQSIISNPQTNCHDGNSLFNNRNANESSGSNMLINIGNEPMVIDNSGNMNIGNNRRIHQNVNGIPGYYMSQPNMSMGSNNQGNHLFIHSNGIVTTMASGHTLSRNTITSVLAGKAHTATTSINASSALPYIYPPNGNSNAQSQNQNIQMNPMNQGSSYPMHVAGTVAQTIVSKSPLEMVQSVVSSIQVSQSHNPSTMSMAPQHAQQFHQKNGNNAVLHSGHILMPSNGQFLVTTSGQGPIMAPPAPKNQHMPPIPGSPLVTSVTGSVTQAIPAVGGMQQVINQPTVLVNTLNTPFMLQPQMMTVDGQVVNQNVQMNHQIMGGNIISQGQIVESNNGQESGRGIMPRPILLSPDAGKKKSKKRKSQGQTVASMLHIAAQHSPGNVIVQHNSQQQPQQFTSQAFQVSPNPNYSAAPMLQALTIVPGKAGGPAHIVMNGQAATNNFGSQQIITSPQGTQHINLLQPVNLLNGTTGVVQNFPTFQQFIVPGLGNMVMTADGTAILQDTSSVPMQLQIQNVNGQNVLTPIQNQGILTAGTTGMVIRTQNANNKMMQSQHSPGAQFLSPTGGQIVMSGSPFNGQLSPLVANVSPNHSVTFNNSPQQVRQQEFIQCNQMGQTLMLPLSPTQLSVSSSSNQQNTTYVQQNTTIVQQQTTMVSNNHNSNQFQNSNQTPNMTVSNTPSLNVDQGVIVNQGKQTNLMKGRHHSILQLQNQSGQLQQQHVTLHNNEGQSVKRIALQYPQMHISQGGNLKNEASIQQIINNINQNNMQNVLHPNVRHSVSTQTLVNQQQQQNGNKSPVASYQQVSGSSPPDTTTHSPLGVPEGSPAAASPANSTASSASRRSHSSQGNQVDTTTGSPEPIEQGSLPMVHCVSSSEPDSADNKDMWGRNTNDKKMDAQGNNIIQQNISNATNAYYTVDSSGIHFNNKTITVSSVNNQQNLTITPNNYYHKVNTNKRAHPSSITMLPISSQAAQDKKMKVSGNNQGPEDICSNQNMGMNRGLANEKNHRNSMTNPDMQRGCNNVEIISSGKRISVSNANEIPTDDQDCSNQRLTSETLSHEAAPRQLQEGDLVWGPARGYPAWPGKLISKTNKEGPDDGKVLIRWFGGDKTLMTVDPAKLQTLSEGLEAHHAARTKCRKSRKLNGQLEKAIQEAMAELDRITELREKLPAESRADELNNSDSKDGYIADINGNSSKTIIKNMKKYPNLSSVTGKNPDNKIIKSPHMKREASVVSTKIVRNPAGSVVKIAPHPVLGAASDVAGRLRSSHR